MVSVASGVPYCGAVLTEAQLEVEGPPDSRRGKEAPCWVSNLDWREEPLLSPNPLIILPCVCIHEHACAHTYTFFLSLALSVSLYLPLHLFLDVSPGLSQGHVPWPCMAIKPQGVEVPKEGKIPRISTVSVSFFFLVKYTSSFAKHGKAACSNICYIKGCAV